MSERPSPKPTAPQIMGEFLMDNGILPPWDAEELLRRLDDGGFQIVPKEPTKEMIQACIWALDRWREKHGNIQGFVPPGDKYQVRWRAMLAAAPSVPCFKAAQNSAERDDPAASPDCHGADTP